MILKFLGNSPNCVWGVGEGGVVYELAAEDADHKVSFYLPQVSMSDIEAIALPFCFISLH